MPFEGADVDATAEHARKEPAALIARGNVAHAVFFVAIVASVKTVSMSRAREGGKHRRVRTEAPGQGCACFAASKAASCSGVASRWCSAFQSANGIP